MPPADVCVCVCYFSVWRYATHTQRFRRGRVMFPSGPAAASSPLWRLISRLEPSQTLRSVARKQRVVMATATSRDSALV